MSTSPPVGPTADPASGVTVRAVRPEEHDRAGQLVIDSYRAIGTMTASYEASIADIGGRITTGAEVLVAVDPTLGPGAGGDGLVIGCVTYAEEGSDSFEGHFMCDATFRMLGVDPAAQGRGAGRALTVACIARARARGRTQLAIYSMEWMPAAHRMYEGLGFIRRPDRDVMFPGGGGVAYAMPLTTDAVDRFGPPGPVPDELPWFEDAWARWQAEGMTQA